MHADPDTVLLVGEKVDVVVAAADRAELRAGGILELRSHVDVPRRVVIEQLMIHIDLVLSADPERQIVEYEVHDRRDVLPDLVGIGIQQHGLVATGNVVSNAGRAHHPVVGDHATDRHGIPEMMIGHQRNAFRILLAVDDLVDRVLLRLSEYRNIINQLIRHNSLYLTNCRANQTSRLRNYSIRRARRMVRGCSSAIMPSSPRHCSHCAGEQCC